MTGVYFMHALPATGKLTVAKEVINFGMADRHV